MMKGYKKYKPSGVEWIGEIPEHWEVNKLKYRNDAIMGQSPSSDDYNYIGIGLPFIQGNAEFKKLHPEPKLWCETANKVAIADDILVSVRAPIGAVNIADQKIGIGRGLCAIRANQDIYKFLYYHFLILNEELNSIGTGSTYTAISAEEVKNVLLITPPTSEQIAIASFLDDKTAQIDTLIAKKQKLIELLKEERTAIINQAVTKGISPKVKLKPSGIDWLGDIPAHWEVKKLKYLTRILSGFSPEQCQPSESAGTIPYIKVDNLNVEHSGIDKTKEFTTEEFIVSFRPSILFPKRGAAIALNKVALVNEPFCMDTNIMGLELKSDEIEIKFIYYFLKSISLISMADTSTIPQINNKHIEPIAIPFLDIREQKEVVAFIENETQCIDATISKIEKEIELLQEYRTALISEVVTGKIRVA